MANRLLTFRPNGRFGNHMFQYIATKVFHYYLPSYVYEFNAAIINPELIITDENFHECLQKAKEGQLQANFICLEGYFQFSDYTIDHSEYIQTLFQKENKEGITFSLQMHQLASYVLDYKSIFTKDDLVVHLRLDDFVQQDKGCAIIHFQSYTDLIDRLREEYKGKVYIIIDKIRYPFEMAYLREFNKYNPVILSGSMQEDFTRCFLAPNMICSNSTFCWIPLLFSSPRVNWFPQSVNIFTNQQFNRVNRLSIEFPTKRLFAKGT